MFRFAREYVRALPDECGVFLAGLTAPPEPFVPDEQKGHPVYLFAIVGLADDAAHSELVAPIRGALATRCSIS